LETKPSRLGGGLYIDFARSPRESSLGSLSSTSEERIIDADGVVQAVLGIAGPDLQKSSTSAEVNLTAGTRRENAWKAIVDRAVELCSEIDMLRIPTLENVETLVALSHALLCACISLVRYETG
jgi:hypothetical protein